MTIREIRDQILAEGYVTFQEVYQPPYTLIGVGYRGVSGFGFAKCLPWEEWDKALGFKIALGRALMSCARQVLESQFPCWVGADVGKETTSYVVMAVTHQGAEYNIRPCGSLL